MKLFYDSRDDNHHLLRRGDCRLYWLDDLGAEPLEKAKPNEKGFLFAGARSREDYRKLTKNYPNIRDRCEERFPLLSLGQVLQYLNRARVKIAMPKTWKLELDQRIPPDITFPLFVRTDRSSWKLGGRISYIRNPTELQEESELLRRAFGWDTVIFAREWLELAEAGSFRFGPLPQEIRIWIIDSIPFAWSFHHLHVVQKPLGFPPSEEDLQILFRDASQVGNVFSSRLVVADFARLKQGGWVFLEAGPGSCAGTAHENVFKAVVCKLIGIPYKFTNDSLGGRFDVL